MPDLDTNGSKTASSSEKRKNLILLVDYENLQCEAREIETELNARRKEVGQDSVTVVPNLEILMRHCRSDGNIVLAFLFVPNYAAGDRYWDEAVEAGFYIIPTSVWKPEKKGHKAYEKADSMMTEIGGRLVALDGIDGIIIVSNDGDFIPLANRALDLGKRVGLVGGSKVSGALLNTLNWPFKWSVPFTYISVNGSVMSANRSNFGIPKLLKHRGPQAPMRPSPPPLPAGVDEIKNSGSS